MKLLVSVRDEAEALLAARNGADFIDLKEPRNGALGGLTLPVIAGIVRALRGDDQGRRLPVSATIGDLPMHDGARIVAAVEAVAACGVDYVKVGIEPFCEHSAALLALLAACRASVVPVFIADLGLDQTLIAQACSMRFPAVMADTADKRSGSLFRCASAEALSRFVRLVQQSGKLVGLAGALRTPDLPLLEQLAPDFAGFRSAVCLGEREAPLDGRLLRELASALAPAYSAFSV